MNNIIWNQKVSVCSFPGHHVWFHFVWSSVAHPCHTSSKAEWRRLTLMTQVGWNVPFRKTPDVKVSCVWFVHTIVNKSHLGEKVMFGLFCLQCSFIWDKYDTFQWSHHWRVWEENDIHTLCIHTYLVRNRLMPKPHRSPTHIHPRNRQTTIHQQTEKIYGLGDPTDHSAALFCWNMSRRRWKPDGEQAYEGNTFHFLQELHKTLFFPLCWWIISRV